MDQVGPIGRDVADCAALMDMIKGKDSRDSVTLDIPDTSYLDGLTGDIRGKRIALPHICFTDGVDADVKTSVLQAAETLRGMGAEVEYVDMTALEYASPAYYVLTMAEGSSNMARFDGVKFGYAAQGTASVEALYGASRREGFGHEVIKRILIGTHMLSAGQYDTYYKKAMQVRALIKREFDTLFETYDAILCPTSPYTAPRLGEKIDPARDYLARCFVVSANLAGLPALSVPCGFDAKGLPVGAHIVGQQRNDGLILNLGYAFQQVTDYHRQRPGEGETV